jgi:hypothetical protein
MPKAQEKQLTIDEVLDSLSPAQKETLQDLRLLVKKTVPETVETIKHGKITYKLGDKDFVWIIYFQTHVDLEFAMGASLDSAMLKNRGTAAQNQNIRHIEVSNFSRLQPELSRLLKQAVSLGFEHCPTKQY